MTYTPENLERWNSSDPAFGSRDNYAGPDLSAFYVAPISNGRGTSEAVTLSNWRVISAELETLANHDESGVARFGHWAVGWYELWLIHESDSAALRCADEWAASLADYCVADESDLSELQYEQEQQDWENYDGQEWRNLIEQALNEYAPDEAGPYWADEILGRLPGESDHFYDLWRELSQHLGCPVEHGPEGCSFDLEGAAEYLTADILAKLTGLPLLPPGQEWRREPYPWPGSEPAPLVLSLPVEG